MGINALVLYGLLVILNVLIVYLYPESKRIHSRRIWDEDRPLTVHKMMNGYLPVLSPNFRRQLSLPEEIMPLGGLPNVKTVFCNEDSGVVTYTSNSFGFRPSASRESNLKPVTIIIGDSYAQGACILNSNYEKPFANKNILNLSMEGNGLSDYYQTLKVISDSELTRNLIILIYSGNDLGETKDDFDRRIKLIPCTTRSLSGFLKISEDKKKSTICPMGIDRASQETALNYSQKYISRYKMPNIYATRFVSTLKLESLNQYLSLFNFAPNSSYLEEIKANSIANINQLIEFLGHTCDPSRCNAKLVVIPNSSYWEPDPSGFNSYQFASMLVKSDLSNLKRNGFADNISFKDCGAIIQRDDFAKKGFHLNANGHQKLWSCIFSEKSLIKKFD